MSNLLHNVCFLVLLFFVFSVFGWCMEVFLKYRQFHRFINRGFLIGPYCPIYGAGAVFVTVTVGTFSKIETSYGSTFVISFFVCGFLEYMVSYYLEKKFHARWWDYSTKPMNLNGRVWIGNLVLFGIGGTFIVKLADPFFFKLFGRLSSVWLYVLSGLIFVVMMSDNVVSHFVMKFVKSSVENSEADDTETISREIRYLLSNRSILHKRIADAYPNVVYRTDKITKKMQEVKAEMGRMKKEASERMDFMEEQLQEKKQNFAAMMETASEIRDDIIAKQDELIHLLDDGTKNEQMLFMLREEIEHRKKQLEGKKKIFRTKQV